MTAADRAMPTAADEYVRRYLHETEVLAQALDREAIEQAIDALRELRQRSGRLFVLGVGGSAANASHAVNDFRKIANLEAYCPTDNVAELTAWTNDDGWQSPFAAWLRTSRLHTADMILVLSVGGGSEDTSANLVRAMEFARQRGAAVLSIVSRDGGRARDLSHICLLIPPLFPQRITAHAEGWQSVLCHLLVNALAES